MTLADLRQQATHDIGGYPAWPPPYAHMSVSLPEAELLYALVRATKPLHVLELGTGLGISGRFIAEAILANRDGWLTTIEPQTHIAKQARELLTEGLPVTISESFGYPDNDLTPRMVVIDSGYERRERDIAEWTQNGYRGLIVVHDADRDYEGLRGLPGVTVPTRDGMWIGRGA